MSKPEDQQLSAMLNQGEGVGEIAMELAAKLDRTERAVATHPQRLKHCQEVGFQAAPAQEKPVKAPEDPRQQPAFEPGASAPSRLLESPLFLSEDPKQTMTAQQEQSIHGYKISELSYWNRVAAYILVAGLLPQAPQRWHIEKSPRTWINRFGHLEKRNYYLLHYRHNGQWRRVYLHLKHAQTLQQLHVTNGHLAHTRQQ